MLHITSTCDVSANERPPCWKCYRGSSSGVCLQVACELELWQEAFRSVEDIQGLSAIGKKPPKPQLMALYYAKLTQIFTVSEAHLYNGCVQPWHASRTLCDEQFH